MFVIVCLLSTLSLQSLDASPLPCMFTPRCSPPGPLGKQDVPVTNEEPEKETEKPPLGWDKRDVTEKETDAPLKETDKPALGCARSPCPPGTLGKRDVSGINEEPEKKETEKQPLGCTHGDCGRPPGKRDVAVISEEPSRI